jgi:hypothetical protein
MNSIKHLIFATENSFVSSSLRQEMNLDELLVKGLSENSSIQDSVSILSEFKPGVLP